MLYCVLYCTGTVRYAYFVRVPVLLFSVVIYCTAGNGGINIVGNYYITMGYIHAGIMDWNGVLYNNIQRTVPTPPPAPPKTIIQVYGAS